MYLVIRARLVPVGLALACVVAMLASAEATLPGALQQLTAPDAQAGDQFGYSIATVGDVAVVGAIRAVVADSQTGAAYVFQRDSDTSGSWVKNIKLTTSDANLGDRVGSSVALSGHTIVVGANRYAGGTGAAYIFQRDEGGSDNWGEVAKLTASDATQGDWFGFSVAIDGDVIVIGSEGEGSAGAGAGAAYVYRRDQGGQDSWGEVAKLMASDARAGDEFGWSVAVADNTVVVGAQDAIGRDQDVDSGAAYVFHRDQGGANAWGEVTKLVSSDARDGDWFGWSVAADGDTMIVGANRAGAAYLFERDEGGENNWGEVAKLVGTGGLVGYSTTINGDTAVVGTDGSGAYVFRRNHGGTNSWGEVAMLTASDDQSDGMFGRSVALGAFAMVGGGSMIEQASATGAVFVFDLLSPKATPTGIFNATPTLAPTATPLPTTTPLSLAGDVNCDAAVDPVDAALVLQFSAGLLKLLDCQDAADVDADRSISSADAALILQSVAGFVVTLLQANF